MINLSNLAELSKDCKLCPLAEQGRTQVVFGDGNPDADIMFVGEGPGFYEDRQGKPFVGAAGKLLTQLLESIGLTREDVYITNVVKCRPPQNRDPKPEEIEICTNEYLFTQIKEIKPKIIATLGRFASAVILERKDVSMGRVHGQKFKKDDYLVVPIYHPAAALHSRTNLGPLSEDFNKLREYLGEKTEVSQGSREPEVEIEQMGLF
ncbi:MAG: uracil-DNA glycosylase [Actinobacteria bacterium]|nr:uracil-DNA glycosylase [Actinomycetota bacterium]